MTAPVQGKGHRPPGAVPHHGALRTRVRFAASAREALELADRHDPGLILEDLGEVTERLSEMVPAVTAKLPAAGFIILPRGEGVHVSRRTSSEHELDG